MGARTTTARSRGFTLVELLVALTIMSIVAGLLVNSISFSINTAEAVEAGILDVESFHQVQRAFRRQVQLAVPIMATLDDEQQAIDFAAAAEQLDFVAPLPALAGGGTLYRISLRVDRDRLIMSYSLYLDGTRDQAASADIREAILLDGFSRASFSYLDALSPGAAVWVDEWRQTNRLPDLVRLTVGATELIVTIKSPLPTQLGDV